MNTSAPHPLSKKLPNAVSALGQADSGQLGRRIVTSNTYYNPKMIDALPDTPMRKIACGRGFSAAITLSEGDLYMWGAGNVGQLGVGEESNVPIPTLIATDVVDVACHSDHVLILSASGAVYSAGGGHNGRLGHDDETDQNVPTRINGLKGINIVQVAAGASHSAAVSGDGKVYTWGSGANGRLGHGGLEDSFEPRLIKSLEGINITKVALGNAHSVFLSQDGFVYSCGDGSYGELGFAGFDLSLPRRIPALRNIIDVACGSSHTLLLRNDGLAISFGLNSHGQLGYSKRILELRHTRALPSNLSPSLTLSPNQSPVETILAIEDNELTAMSTNSEEKDEASRTKSHVKSKSSKSKSKLKYQVVSSPDASPLISTVIPKNSGDEDSLGLRDEFKLVPNETETETEDADDTKSGSGSGTGSIHTKRSQEMYQYYSVPPDSSNSMYSTGEGKNTTPSIRIMAVAGEGYVEYSVKPHIIPDLERVWHISAFGNRCVAVCDSGVYSWGDSSPDGLGHGKSSSASAASAASAKAKARAKVSHDSHSHIKAQTQTQAKGKGKPTSTTTTTSNEDEDQDKGSKIFSPRLIRALRSTKRSSVWQAVVGGEHMMFLFGPKISDSDSNDSGHSRQNPIPISLALALTRKTQTGYFSLPNQMPSISRSTDDTDDNAAANVTTSPTVTVHNTEEDDSNSDSDSDDERRHTDTDTHTLKSSSMTMSSAADLQNTTATRHSIALQSINRGKGGKGGKWSHVHRSGVQSGPSSPRHTSALSMDSLRIDGNAAASARASATPTYTYSQELTEGDGYGDGDSSLSLLPYTPTDLLPDLLVIGDAENIECSSVRTEIQLDCLFESEAKIVIVNRKSTQTQVQEKVWKAFRRSLLLNHDWVDASGNSMVAVWSAPLVEMVLQSPTQKKIGVVLLEGTDMNASMDIKMCTDSDLRQKHDAAITCMITGNELYGNEKTLFTGDLVGVIRGWKTTWPGSCTHVFRGHSDRVNAIILVSDNLLLSVSNDRTIRLWNVRTMENTATVTCDLPVKCAVIDDKGRILTADTSGTVQLWFASDRMIQEVAELNGLECPINQIILSGSGCYAGGGTAMAGYIGFWDLDKPGQNREVIAVCEGHSDAVTDMVAVSTVLYSISSDKTIRAWNPVVGLCRRELRLQVQPLCLLATPSMLYVGCQDGHIFAYSSADFLSEEADVTPDFVFAGHRDQVNCMVLHDVGPNSLLLITGSGYNGEDRPCRDCSICVWDANTGVLLRRLHGHTAAITNLLIGDSAGGSNLVYSADRNGRGCQWVPGPSSGNDTVKSAATVPVNTVGVKGSGSQPKTSSSSSLQATSTDFKLIFSNFADQLRYTVKPRARVPVDYFKSFFDFVQLASFPFLLSLPWSPSASFMKVFFQSFVLEIDIPAFGWLIGIGLFLLIFFLSYFLSPAILFQRIRNDKMIGHPMKWNVLWVIAWSIVMVGSTVIFLPMVRSAGTVFVCENGFSRQNSAVACWTPLHFVMIGFSALILLIYLPICLRLAGVDGDVSRVAPWKVFGWKHDVPDVENVHASSVRSYSFHRLLAAVKVLSAFSSMLDAFVLDKKISEYVTVGSLIVLQIALLLVIAIDPPYHRRGFNVIRFASFVGVLYTDVISIGVAVLNDPMNDIPPYVYYGTLLLFIAFGAWVAGLIFDRRAQRMQWKNYRKMKPGISTRNLKAGYASAGTSSRSMLADTKKSRSMRSQGAGADRSQKSSGGLVRRMSSLFIQKTEIEFEIEFDCTLGYSGSSYTRTAVSEAAEIVSTSLLGAPSMLIVAASSDHDPDKLRKALAASFGGAALIHGVSSTNGLLHGSKHSADKETYLGIFGISDQRGAYGMARGSFEIDDPDDAHIRKVTMSACRKALKNAEIRHENGPFGSRPFPGPPTAVIVSYSLERPSKVVMQTIREMFSDPHTIVLGGGLVRGDTFDFNGVGMPWMMMNDEANDVGIHGLVISVLCTSVEVSNSFVDTGYAPTAYVGEVTKSIPGYIVEIDHKPARDVYESWIRGIESGAEPEYPGRKLRSSRSKHYMYNRKSPTAAPLSRGHNSSHLSVSVASISSSSRRKYSNARSLSVSGLHSPSQDEGLSGQSVGGGGGGGQGQGQIVRPKGFSGLAWHPLGRLEGRDSDQKPYFTVFSTMKSLDDVKSGSGSGSGSTVSFLSILDDVAEGTEIILMKEQMKKHTIQQSGEVHRYVSAVRKAIEKCDGDGVSGVLLMGSAVSSGIMSHEERKKHAKKASELLNGKPLLGLYTMSSVGRHPSLNTDEGTLMISVLAFTKRRRIFEG